MTIGMLIESLTGKAGAIRWATKLRVSAGRVGCWDVATAAEPVAAPILWQRLHPQAPPLPRCMLPCTPRRAPHPFFSPRHRPRPRSGQFVDASPFQSSDAGQPVDHTEFGKLLEEAGFTRNGGEVRAAAQRSSRGARHAPGAAHGCRGSRHGGTPHLLAHVRRRRTMPRPAPPRR